MIKFVKYLITLVFCISVISSFAQEDGGKKLRNARRNPRVKTRVSFSPVLGFYKTNKNHATQGKPKMAFNFSLKEEIRINRTNTDFLLLGIEYFNYSMSFNSYYFYADSIQLYNKDKMYFKYSLNVHELDFPILLKHSFQKETNTLVSSYIFAGYCYRLFLSSKLKVDDNGNELVNQNGNLKFKNKALSSVANSFLSVGAGIQRNTQLRQNAVYGEIQFRYGLSPFYFNDTFAPSSMYVNSHFLLITVGVEF